MKRFIFGAIAISLISFTSLNIAYSDEHASAPKSTNIQMSANGNLAPVPHNNSQPKLQPTLQLSNDELYALQKLRIQKELQDEITAWFRYRFWFVAIFTFLVGIFGVRALVREFVSTEIKEAMKATADAEAAASSARESIKEVRKEAENYKELVGTACITADIVNKRLQELSSRIDSEGERSIAATEIKISAINKQVGELQNMLSQLGSESEKNKKMIKEASLRLTQTREDAEFSEKEFSSNSAITVSLVPFDEEFSKSLAAQIGSQLTHSGYKTSLAPWGDEKKNAQGGVCISYMPLAKQKAKNIEKIIGDVFKQNGIAGTIRMESKDKPISNSKSQIVVFFE